MVGLENVKIDFNDQFFLLAPLDPLDSPLRFILWHAFTVLNPLSYRLDCTEDILFSIIDTDVSY